MLQYTSRVELPEHVSPGGFDHADIHPPTRRLYLAHTCNNAVDVIDCAETRYDYSIPNLTGIAGALVSGDWVFTSNRGEDTVSIFSSMNERNMIKVPVGNHPNGLAFDPQRKLLLVANAGIPDKQDSYTLSIVDVDGFQMVHSIAVPGRTRWAIFDANTESFYVNIANPALIVSLKTSEPSRIFKSFVIPATGPHGLDIDEANHRLFCACDGGKLISVIIPSGEIRIENTLSGSPDVVFYHPSLQHLYIASGDVGVLDVIDTKNMTLIESYKTSKGAHTFALEKVTNTLYVFEPHSHSAAVLVDL